MGRCEIKWFGLVFVVTLNYLLLINVINPITDPLIHCTNCVCSCIHLCFSFLFFEFVT